MNKLPLYPDIELPASASANLSNRQKILIAKSREISYKIKNSAFYVRSTTEVPDVIRYEYGRASSEKSNKRFLPDASNVLSNCLGGQKCTAMGAFFPDELVTGQHKTRKAFRSVSHATKRKRRGNDIDGILESEQDIIVKDEDNERDDDDDDEVFEEEEEEEENEDYIKDYYQSDDDFEDDVGESEPIF